MTWSEIEKRRLELQISRAQLCRVAIISESTMFKGLRQAGTPTAVIAAAIERAFEVIENARAKRAQAK